MTELTATGDFTVIASGFLAKGSMNQSDGYGGSRTLGYFSTIEEAIDAARGQGVQGDPGEVSRFETRLYEGGLTDTITKGIIARRQGPDRSYTVGFLDFREYEYGIRRLRNTPVRPSDNSILSRTPFQLVGEEAENIEHISAEKLKARLNEDPQNTVGLWRRAGEEGWRGEFLRGSDSDMARNLPRD